GKITCVEGEASGHHHAVMDPTAAKVFRARITPPGMESYETLLAIVQKDLEFSHYDVNTKELTEEHATLVLKGVIPGEVYEINQQREMSMENEIMRVVD